MQLYTLNTLQILQKSLNSLNKSRKLSKNEEGTIDYEISQQSLRLFKDYEKKLTLSDGVEFLRLSKVYVLMILAILQLLVKYSNEEWIYIKIKKATEELICTQNGKVRVSEGVRKVILMNILVKFGGQDQEGDQHG